MPDRQGLARCWIAIAALIGIALVGCSRHSSPTAQDTGALPPPPFAKSNTGETYDKRDPCNLLDPKEVEAVLGAPLAVPPYRSANATADPTPTGESCVYEAANFRYIDLQVTYEGGALAASMTGMVKNLLKSGGGAADIKNNVSKNFRLDDGTEIAGEWDEASLTPMNCCIFSGLRGDQLITIDFTASPATLRQAATLVDGAYKRIDHPLKIDGGAGVAAAKALNKTRPQPKDVCSLLSRAEVEAILGHLAKDPISRGQDGCTYEVPVPPQTPPQQYELTVRWRGGYYQWRSDRHVARIGTAAVGQIAADVAKQMGHPLPESGNASPEPSQGSAGTAPPGTDPAGSVSDTGLHFAGVKRDVQVSINEQFVDPDKAKALAAAVLAKT
ncbi:MAG TPA: hypothetical protein VK676_06630 [Steroidobacteraceae bacterium]|nr:hypothetical protein [Steroidobacteraceae bacterium]